MLTPCQVGKVVGVTGRQVKEWAANSIRLIQSWEWELHVKGEGLRAAQPSLIPRIGPIYSSHGMAWAIKTEQDPEPKISWEWISLPDDAPARFSERVLLRTSEGLLARHTMDDLVVFLITRQSLGSGRGRGWQFRRALIGDQLYQQGDLPPWLTRSWTVPSVDPD
jgi:hypothetical protein